MHIPEPNLESVSTINPDGSRRFLHPFDVRGPFSFLRRLLGLLLIAVYVALPWIKINGYPAVFLDLLHRRFHFFGITLAAQDFWVAFFLISGVAFSLFYVTALLGRLWCGWACPYTVFLEHVYRRVERWIDGDAPARRKLDDAPWTASKIVRRVLKHGIYLLLSALIANIFLSYFVSLPRLYEMMGESPAANAKAFGVVAFLTGALYFCFAWFREQFCIILCPYGRIQSALTDEHTVIIGYDEKRGEPRGKASDPNAGDCIDCHRCVQVCPTGIDIRNGLQLECIGCSNCIDACDAIMAKLNRPKGLVRYASEEGLEGRKTKFVRPRIVLYTILLALGVAVFAISVRGLKPIGASAVRMRGSAYYVTDGYVRNQFMVHLLNKRNRVSHFIVKLVDPPEGAEVSGFENSVPVPPMGEEAHPLIVRVPVDRYEGPFTVTYEVSSEQGKARFTKDVAFLGPEPELLREALAEEAASKPIASP